ncbi:MAG: T9SS type A sorting domain-containing protein [Bacteroidetes bacterium]|nr:T9SS type A sorting domain-containing protein [Bacteroidota bacterium]
MKKVRLLILFLTIFTFGIKAQSEITVTGDISTNTTWTADHTYLLDGFVHVLSGATLTIEAGTTIYGKIGTKASLIVRQGGKLNAIGTSDKPIVFTSEYTKPGASQNPAAGDWGGIILLGKAPINPSSGTGVIEGTGDANDIYGGTDPDDNSGTLKYVRIEFPGVAFSKDNEINGLTFGGVGRGTTIDYIQVYYSGDDSYEWFGGTVNCKHLIAFGGVDDDFDTDFGFQGKLQFLLGVRDANVADQAGTSNGFESDNDGSGSLNNPRTSPTWWNVTLIGPKATSTTPIDAKYDHGLHLRRSSQNKIQNLLMVGWAKDGIYIDGKQTNQDAKDGLWWIKNSIIAGAAKKIDSTKSVPGFDINQWFTDNSNQYFSDNDAAKLTNPFFLARPDAMPKVGSPALTGGLTPPADGFFDVSANFIGAFKSEDWLAGWTKFNFGSEVTVSGDISANTTWTADHTYLLDGFVHVLSGATLTIEPGTTIYGKIGTKASLIVRQGGKLNAIGTSDKPIVFTSEYTKPGSSQAPAAGDWGGIILLGKAPINPSSGTGVIEGTGDANDIYGGTDPDDNSGTLKYVRIEFPGVAFSKDNEINGLTFGGVGRGTTIDYIQVYYSGDDSYEWFGGTVNCKHLIAFGGVDDDFDTDFGFQGKLQFLLGVRDANVADQAGTSNGFESDNDGSGSLNNPRTSPTWWNVTLIGPKATSTTPIDAKYDHGLHLRRSSQNKIQNLLMVGWAKDGIYIDGKQTNQDAKDGLWWIKNSIIAGAAKKIDSTKSVPGFDINQWFTDNSNQYFSDNNSAGLSNPFAFPNPNALPKSNSPALTLGATPTNDGFFDATANYVGAFKDVDWTAGWSRIHMSIVTSVKEKVEEIIPSKYELSQNYPNPFNPSTTIRYSIPEAGNIKLNVYNMLGQEVASLVNGFKQAGTYSITWNANNLASGIYFYTLQTGSFRISKKMLLIK